MQELRALILACQFVLATTTPTRGTVQVTAALTSFSVGRWIGPLAGMGRHKSPLHQGAPGRLTSRHNSVRKTVLALVVIGLGWIGSLLWPRFNFTRRVGGH